MAPTRLRYLKVKTSGRSHLACERCRGHKIKCSGEQPKCWNCQQYNKNCEYPRRDRIISVSELELDKLQERIAELEEENEELKTKPSKSRSGRPDTSYSETILGDNLFQASTVTDSSTYSILDIGIDDSDPNLGKKRDLARFFHTSKDLDGPDQIFGFMNLPDKNHSLRLVNKTITLIGHEYYLFEVTEFLNEIETWYEDKVRTNDPAWMCYFLITLAIGQQYENQPHKRSEVPGLKFYVNALELFHKVKEEPDLRYVQTLLLFAFYQQGLNRSHSASCFYGLAIRSALSLGYHRKNTQLSMRTREQRRRVWWTCYIMDCIWSAKLGQPIHVQPNDISVEMEELFDLEDKFQTEILKTNSELAIIITEIIGLLYKPNIEKKISDLLYCMKKLSSFQQVLPTIVRKLVIDSTNRMSANIYLRLNQIVIITIRPLLFSIVSGENIEKSTDMSQAVKKCLSAASSNISILMELEKVELISYFGFWDARYLFSSLLVLYMNGNTQSNIIKQGRDLNKKMSLIGNFAAIENEIRFGELDKIYNSKGDTGHFTGSQMTLPISEVRSGDIQSEIQYTFSEDNCDALNGNIDEMFSSLLSDIPPELYKSLSNSFKAWDDFGL